jgi:hypothetical protein
MAAMGGQISDDDDEETMRDVSSEDIDHGEGAELLSAQNVPARVREYPVGHKGPFVVFIKERSASLAHITISKRLNETFRGKIKSLVRVARSKIRVELDSASVANDVLKAQFLGIYLTYIPAETVEVDGVIALERGYDLKDIVENGVGKYTHPQVSPTKVVHAYRFRRVKSDNGEKKEYEDTEAVRVTFSGTALPRWLLIHGLLVPVRLYSPKLMSCSECLGDHHTAKHCNTRVRCLKCKGDHSTVSCKDKTPWCSHCGKNIVHGGKEECEAYFMRSQKLRNNAKKNSRKSYAEAVRSADENFYASLRTQEDEETEQPTTSAIKFPKLTRSPVDRGSRSAANNGGGKRPRTRSKSPTESLEDFFGRDNVEQFLGRGASGAREPEPKKRNRRRNTRNNDTNISPTSFKESLASLIGSLGLSPNVCSMINFAVSSLVDLLWPTVSSFLSKIFGSTSSAQEIPSSNIHG